MGLELNYMQIKKRDLITPDAALVYIFRTKKVSLVACRILQRDSGGICNEPSTVRRQIGALNTSLNKVQEHSALETAEVKWTRCKT